MTTATKITVFRLVAVPFFIAACAGYGVAAHRGEPEAENWRWAMVIIFALAAISDAVDGWVARTFNQQSAQGAAMDAIADKALMLTALLAVSFLPGEVRLPIWYACLVIGRDLATLAAGTWLHFRGRRLEVRPHWTGKLATAFQVICVVWALLMVRVPDILWPVGISTALTLSSAIIYARAGLRLKARPKQMA